MNQVKIDNFSKLFLMQKENEKYLSGKTTWTGQRKHQLLKLIICVGMLIAMISATIFLTIPSRAQGGMGIFTYIVGPIFFLFVFALYVLLNYINVSYLEKNAVLLIGTITDFKVEKGEWSTIEVSYEFDIEGGETISGNSKSSLTYSTYNRRKIERGGIVIVQFIDKLDFNIL